MRMHYVKQSSSIFAHGCWMRWFNRLTFHFEHSYLRTHNDAYTQLYVPNHTFAYSEFRINFIYITYALQAIRQSYDFCGIVLYKRKFHILMWLLLLLLLDTARRQSDSYYFFPPSPSRSPPSIWKVLYYTCTNVCSCATQTHQYN